VQEPDPSVVRAAARGDVAAFTEVVRTLQAPVWRFLVHLVGDPALAEDLTQEVFLKVHRQLRAFRYRSHLSTWVLAIARNAGIDALRRRERRARLLTELEPPTPTGDRSAAIEVTAALESLSVPHRDAFLLIELLGLSYREAGVVLRVPEGTVKSRVHHARRHLVAWMAAGDDEEAAGAV
jgi:RNA polymerase sigma-70 factor (ECF subfamily)